MAKKRFLDYSGLQKISSRFKVYIDNKVADITPSSIGAMRVANLFSITLESGNWIDGAQTVSNSLIETDGYIYAVFPDAMSEESYSVTGIKAQDVTNPGIMSFICDSTPNADITVNILKLEVN